MTAPTNETPPALLSVADLRGFAAEMRAKFSDGKRMSIRGSDVVHAVDNERWLHGELIPQPKCHTAVYGWSPGALRAVRAPVSCAKCIRILATPEQILLPYGEFQPPLFTVVPEDQHRADVT